MLYLIKNAQIYAPTPIGIRDILLADNKIVAIEKNIQLNGIAIPSFDAEGSIITPGFIDQHIHIDGAGGKDGFMALTPEVSSCDLVQCGTTTTVGLLGTDGTVKAIKSLYGKVQSLRQEGFSSYMFTGYYGLDSTTITDSVQNDMVFIEPVLGLKIAISDIRSSFPTALELARKLRAVWTGGLLSQKKGIMHVHLGPLESKMDILFELVENYHFPIKHISPTHVGRTLPLFEQAIAFAKLGGMIDITTAASKYTDPYKSVIYALDQGVDISKMTFSTDGHAGLTKLDENGKPIGFRQARIDENYREMKKLVQLGGLPLDQALKLITTNPANNLGIKNKGQIAVGCDADICVMNEDLTLTHVFANGKMVMSDKKITYKPPFEKLNYA